MIWILLLIAFGLGPELFTSYDPNRQNLRATLEPASAQHWVGTDHLGRDIWSRLVFGTRISLQVGGLAVAAAGLAGFVLGLSAGFYEGVVGILVMRITDALWCVPSLVLAVALVAVRGPGLGNVILAVGLVYLPAFARLARAQVLSTKQLPFVEAARALGAGNGRIMLRHITPNVLTPIVVQASLSVGHAIIVEASLSFLGVGIAPPTATWGGLLRDGFGFIYRAPTFSVAPGIFLFLTVLAANFLGDALRDGLDPRMRGRH
jgi:peptide/nickel transport system permease protein